MSHREESTDLDDADVLRAIGDAIRRGRATKNWSVRDLGAATRLSKTLLSDLERGNGNPSVRTLARIADALDVPLASLLHTSAYTMVVRGSDIPMREGTLGGAHSRVLFDTIERRRVEISYVTLVPGSRATWDSHSGFARVEYAIVVRGEADVGVVGEEVHLKEGDAMMFRADRPHVYSSENGALAVSIVAYEVA